MTCSDPIAPRKIEAPPASFHVIAHVQHPLPLYTHGYDQTAIRGIPTAAPMRKVTCVTSRIIRPSAVTRILPLFSIPTRLHITMGAGVIYRLV